MSRSTHTNSHNQGEGQAAKGRQRHNQPGGLSCCPLRQRNLKVIKTTSKIKLGTTKGEGSRQACAEEQTGKRPRLLDSQQCNPRTDIDICPSSQLGICKPPKSSKGTNS
jgi:hypothetical protein